MGTVYIPFGGVFVDRNIIWLEKLHGLWVWIYAEHLNF